MKSRTQSLLKKLFLNTLVYILINLIYSNSNNLSRSEISRSTIDDSTSDRVSLQLFIYNNMLFLVSEHFNHLVGLYILINCNKTIGIWQYRNLHGSRSLAPIQVEFGEHSIFSPYDFRCCFRIILRRIGCFGPETKIFSVRRILY